MITNNRITSECIILAVFLFFFGCGTKEVTTYYSFGNGAVKNKYNVNKFTKKIEGLMLTYSPDGVLLSELPYKSGKINGVGTTFCDNSNTPLEISNFLNNKLNGETIGYYCKNGQQRFSVLYDNDKIIRVYGLYTLEGEALYAGNHEEGNGEVLKYDEKGNVSAMFTLKNGLIDGYYYVITNTNHIDSFFYSKGYCKELRTQMLHYAPF